MNTLKIINNNVHGKTSGSSDNAYSKYSTHAVFVYSDNEAFTSNENPPKVIISNNFIDGTYSKAIKSTNNSKISKNKISGEFSSEAIFVTQDCEIVGNNVEANCNSSIYATINSNITGNNLKGFDQYGVRFAGGNLSGNTISRDDGKDILAFVIGATNGGVSGNKPALVVDNVFSHDTVDGYDNEIVKKSNNWIVERNLPKYIISTPIINIRSVNGFDELAALTEMQHNEVCMVAGAYDQSLTERLYSYGLWRFVKGSKGEELFGSRVYIKANDGSGSWQWIDSSRINASLGIPRLDIDGNFSVTKDTIKKLKIMDDGYLDVFGELNINEGATLNISKLAKVNYRAAYDVKNLDISQMSSRTATASGGYYPDGYLISGSDVDEWVIKCRNDGHFNSYHNDYSGQPFLRLRVPNQNELGYRVRFGIGLANAGRNYVLKVEDSNGNIGSSYFAICASIVAADYDPDENGESSYRFDQNKMYRWVEYVAIRDFNGNLSWKLSACERWFPGI